MPVIIDGTTGITTPGEINTGNLSVAGSTTLTTPLPVAYGGTGASSLSGITTGTSTNLAGGSNGTIPYQSAAGTTQMLAVGTAGQLLQTNGVSAPSWVTASASALTFLSTVTASSAATVDIETTFNSTYNNYMLVANDITPQTDGMDLRIRLKTGGAYITSATYNYHSHKMSNLSSTYDCARNNNDSHIVLALGVGDSSLAANNLSVNIFDTNNTSKERAIYFTGSFALSGNSPKCGLSGFGSNTSTGVLQGIRIYMSSGNISGTFRLYGIANS